MYCAIMTCGRYNLMIGEEYRDDALQCANVQFNKIMNLPTEHATCIIRYSVYVSIQNAYRCNVYLYRTDEVLEHINLIKIC